MHCGLFEGVAHEKKILEIGCLKRLVRNGRKIVMGVKKLLTVFCLLMLGGCSAVGPDYSLPTVEMGDAWQNTTRGTSQDEQALSCWWRSLNDPILTSLIVDAEQNNLDLQVARSRVRQARMERTITGSSRYPTLDSNASANRSYSNGNDSGSRESDTYAVGFDASWEIDLFGGVRRSVEASQADYEASVEEMRDTLVSLVAEVALDYVELRAYQTRLKVAKEQVASQEETLGLLVALSEAGRGDELAISQARYAIESAKASLLDMESALEISMNGLAILTGKAPGALEELLNSPQPVPQVATELAIGIPADILRRRPDIRKAERELAAETARIGEAEAALYPSLSLKGTIGLESVDLGDLVSSPIRVVSIGPTLSWPIFNAGALRNQVKIQTEQQNQAFINYTSAILTATEEVENALVSYAKEQGKSLHLQAAVNEAKLAEKLAGMQYSAGVTDFTDVLDAQRSILSLQDQLIQSSAETVTNLISIYKAVGGGWQPIREGEYRKPGNKNEQ